MKTKKKQSQNKNNNMIKLLNIKTLEQPEKNTTSTKQKTFATIEENLKTFQGFVQSSSKRQSLPGRLSFNRKSYNQKMQQHNLSPFSNDQRSSSPKYRKTPQKLFMLKQEKQKSTQKSKQKEIKLIVNLKELQKKKSLKQKQTSHSARQNRQKNTKKPQTKQSNTTKKLITPTNSTTKKKTIISQKHQKTLIKQQQARIQFQNEFLNMMNNRLNIVAKNNPSSTSIHSSSYNHQNIYTTNSNSNKQKITQLSIEEEDVEQMEDREEYTRGREKNILIKKPQLKILCNSQQYANTSSNQSDSMGIRGAKKDAVKLVHSCKNNKTYLSNVRGFGSLGGNSFGGQGNMTKQQIVKVMKIKIFKNISKDYPNLEFQEKKVMCAVIIIQRLWRQRKVKQFFQHYVAPKSSPQSSFRQSLQKDFVSLKSNSNNNSSTMNILNSHFTKSSNLNQQVINSQQIPSAISKDSNNQYNQKLQFYQQKQKPLIILPTRKIVKNYEKSVVNNKDITQNFLIREKSASQQQFPKKIQKGQSVKMVKKQSQLNDKVTQLFSEYTSSLQKFQNENQKIIKQSLQMSNPQNDKQSMIRFLQCYREIRLNSSKNKGNDDKFDILRENMFSVGGDDRNGNKGKKKQKNKNRENIYSLKESFSEKCLMQKYYTKIFSDRPQKNQPKNYELFHSYHPSNLPTNLTKQTLKHNQKSSIQLFKQISATQFQQKSQNQHEQHIKTQLSQSEQSITTKKKQPQNVSLLQENQNKQKIADDQVVFQGNDTGKKLKNKIVQQLMNEDVFVSQKYGFNRKDYNNQQSIEKINEQQHNDEKKQYRVQNLIILQTEQKEQCHPATIINKKNALQNQKQQSNNNNTQSYQNQTRIQTSNQIGYITNIRSITPTSYSQDIKKLSTISLRQYQPSIKSIQKVAQNMLEQLLGEFFIQYVAFQDKIIKKKKKKKRSSSSTSKKRYNDCNMNDDNDQDEQQQQQQNKKDSQKLKLPGIDISIKSINSYLSILTNYIFDQSFPTTTQPQSILNKDQPKLQSINKISNVDTLKPKNLNKNKQLSQLHKSLLLFTPQKYQKCHRVQSIIYDLFQYQPNTCKNFSNELEQQQQQKQQQFQQNQDQQQFYWNIISNQGFFKCLQMYWENNVKLKDQEIKYKNFIDLTCKVYNRCITDAFSELLNKEILQMICYPWENRSKGCFNRRGNNDIKLKRFQRKKIKKYDEILTMVNINNLNSNNFKHELTTTKIPHIQNYSLSLSKLITQHPQQNHILNQIMKNVCIKLLTQSICYSNNNGVLKNRKKRKGRGMGLVYGTERNRNRNRDTNDDDKWRLDGQREFGEMMKEEIGLGQQNDNNLTINNYKTQKTLIYYHDLTRQQNNQISLIINDQFCQQQRQLQQSKDQKYEIIGELGEMILLMIVEQLEYDILSFL